MGRCLNSKKQLPPIRNDMLKSTTISRKYNYNILQNELNALKEAKSPIKQPQAHCLRQSEKSVCTEKNISRYLNSKKQLPPIRKDILKSPTFSKSKIIRRKYNNNMPQNEYYTLQEAKLPPIQLQANYPKQSEKSVFKEENSKYLNARKLLSPFGNSFLPQPPNIPKPTINKREYKRIKLKDRINDLSNEKWILPSLPKQSKFMLGKMEQNICKEQIPTTRVKVPLPPIGHSFYSQKQNIEIFSPMRNNDQQEKDFLLVRSTESLDSQNYRAKNGHNASITCVQMSSSMEEQNVKCKPSSSFVIDKVDDESNINLVLNEGSQIIQGKNQQRKTIWVPNRPKC